MPVGAVYLSSETYLTCLNHALSTEKEEIMGLLLGRVVHSSPDNNDGSSHIENVVILQRSDRQADRVEISPLQLMMATQEAENLSSKLGRPVRVLGWYHSHPHITVRPSHVGKIYLGTTLYNLSSHSPLVLSQMLGPKPCTSSWTQISSG